jgi:predicted nucleic-acid-binding protein
MTKKIFLIALVGSLLSLTACDVLTNVASTVLTTALSNEDIGNGLKAALNLGIGKGADALSQKGGYFNSAYKILLPEEARQITDKLKVIPGFTQLENNILEKINAGAEDAAVKAKPIFINAIKQMTFSDALNILMGDKNAATEFLKRTTYDQLYKEFNPNIVESLDKFGARKLWSDATGTYNSLPFVKKTNPSLDDYVTKEALNGLFAMVEQKERSIRANQAERTTTLLQNVFAKQDAKQ